MIAPAWLATRTQPIGIDDVLSYLALAAQVDESAGVELQIGGPDILTYGEMLDAMALALAKLAGKRSTVTLVVRLDMVLPSAVVHAGVPRVFVKLITLKRAPATHRKKH